MGDWALAGFTELEQLGEGGFGRVVLARHDGTGHLVAIKYLYARYASDETFRAQFRHEAAILRRVVSPHVARLYEFVESPQGAAIVMEAVPGVSLRAILTRDGALPPESALTVLKGSLLGLAAAHAVGTVHRDYKPGNVLVRPDRQSKLVDFGIAALAGQAGHTGGTPAYMAPEQWRGGPATPATDVYAATCVFFQCVTGHRPYDAQDTTVLRDLHEQGPIPLGEVPDPVRDLVARGMAKDAAQRPAGAAAFVAELEAAAQAGYGKDWEQRGWQRLAASAGALLALSPLALLATATGALAPGAGALAGGAAGATVGKSVLGGAVAKIAATIAGLAVVTGAAVVVIANSGDEPRSPPLEVSLGARSERFSDPDFDVNAQFVRVSGHPNASAQARINEALMAPVDERVDEVRRSLDSARSDPAHEREPDGDIPHVRVAAHIRLQTPTLLSVRYDHTLDSDILWHSSWDRSVTVTVDFTTGRKLGNRELFLDTTLTEQGMATLTERLLARAPDGFCGTRNPGFTVSVDPRSDEAHLPAASLALTPEGVEFVVDLNLIGFSEACGQQTVAVPYGEVTDLMRSDVVALLPGNAPPPTSSARPTSGAPREVRLGGLTLALPEGWQTREQGVEQVVVAADGCAKPVDPRICTHFVVSDNGRSTAEQPAYVPGKPYARSATGRSCMAIGRPDLSQTGEHSLVRKETVSIGTEPAEFEEWRVGCVDAAGRARAELTQRVWYLPRAQLVVVDEWNTPGLTEILRDAHVG